ncbi:MAG: MBL fold metallo-hydrolase, partial [Dehalococcoidales bacterium]
DTIAIDAGGLTSSLSMDAQLKLNSVLLTHQHYDHIRDIPSLLMNFYLRESSVDIYSSQEVYRVLSEYLLNGQVYPEFLKETSTSPANFIPVEPYHTYTIGSHSIFTVRSNHSVPTLGFQIKSADGKKVLYTGDTGPGLDFWQQVSPDLLITEVIASNRYNSFAMEKGHLTPSLLEGELKSFQKAKNYLPQVVLIHLYPDLEDEIKAEIDSVARRLQHNITTGYEGIEISL